MKPYFTSHDGTITIYHGDCREIVLALPEPADMVLADPPYGETSLSWDDRVDGWQESTAALWQRRLVASRTRSLSSG